MDKRRELRSTAQSESAAPEAARDTRRVLRTDERAVSDTEPTLRQPDERDESADQQTTPPRDVIKQAHDDVQSGQQDTDCRNRVPEALPDQPKTPENFDKSDRLDSAPRAVKQGSK